MAIKDNKITSWTNPIVNEADRPQRTASEMKAVFDSNSNQLRTALNGLIDDLSQNGAAELPAASLEGVDGTTVEEQLAGLKKYADEREEAAKEYADNLSFDSGAADMRKSVYDPQGKEQDAFAYADTAVGALKTEVNRALSAKENKSTTTTATLLASGWTGTEAPFTQTVTVAGVSADSTVDVSAAPDSFLAYCAAQVRATGQAENALTFACEEVPEADLIANVRWASV